MSRKPVLDVPAPEQARQFMTTVPSGYISAYELQELYTGFALARGWRVWAWSRIAPIIKAQWGHPQIGYFKGMTKATVYTAP